MENASNALIMAAAILIGILILSLGVYLANIMSGYAEITQKQMEQNSLNQFNDRFLKYDSLDCTIQDVITVKNYALESNNQTAGYNPLNDRAQDDNAYIDVYLGTSLANAKLLTSIILNKSDEDLLNKNMQELENNIANGKTDNIKYKCKVETNTNTGRVSRIYFYIP